MADLSFLCCDLNEVCAFFCIFIRKDEKKTKISKNLLTTAAFCGIIYSVSKYSSYNPKGVCSQMKKSVTSSDHAAQSAENRSTPRRKKKRTPLLFRLVGRLFSVIGATLLSFFLIFPICLTSD